MSILRGIHVIVGIVLIFLIAPNRAGAIAFTFLLGGSAIMALSTLKVMGLLSGWVKRLL